MMRRILRGSMDSEVEFARSAGEVVKQQGIAAISRGLFGGRWGPLILTNQRLVWHEAGPVWPLRQQTREVNLRDVAKVDKGSLFDAVFGGRRIRLHLHNGRTVKFFEGQGRLDWWIAELNNVVGDEHD